MVVVRHKTQGRTVEYGVYGQDITNRTDPERAGAFE